MPRQKLTNRWWTLFLTVAVLGTPAMAQNVFNCTAFTSTGPCSASTGGNGGNFVTRNGAGLQGNLIDMIPSGSTHNGFGLWYTAQQDIRAFSTTFQWIPNGQNFAFVIQNTNNNTGYQGTSFASGAGCEAGFYQIFVGGPPNENNPNNLFALEFDQYSLLNYNDSAFTYSSVQIYMSAQSPCSPNDSGTGYWPVTKFSTTPVAMNAPATNRGVTTGDTYSATVTYDGSNLVLTMYDVTASGSCPGSSCFTHTWSNVRMPSLVGATTALIGFTGGIGEAVSTQQSLTQWSYTVNSPSATPTSTAPAAGATPATNPTFTPAAGSYTGTQSVSLSSSTTGAYFCYTLASAGLLITPLPDNLGDCAVGTLYTGAVPVPTSETMYAITGTNATGLPSGVAQAPYTITGGTPQAATPAFSPAAGTYTSAQSVTISDTTAGATVYYTTDGSTPTTSSSTYTTPIAVSSTRTLQAIATASGFTQSAVGSAAYTITPVAATPTFSPGAGTYSSAQSVAISDATSGATIYYTTNGATPTTSSAVYSGAIPVSSTETVQAIATASGYTQSAVGSAPYTINLPVVATPTFSPGAGTYSSAQSVAISDSTSGATIYYTTNGATPTTSSAVYSGAISVSSTETLQAIATASGYTQSAVGSAAYTINLPVAATPTFSPAAGTYGATQSVAISDSTSGAAIYYTTNGSTPTTASTVYSGAITVSSTQTLKAIATASGYTQSAVGSATYTITSAAATPTFSPGAGTYGGTQSVAISDSTAGATIYYTTNGTTPTTSSIVYTGAITVSSTQTLQAIATASGYTQSAVGSAAYTINPVTSQGAVAIGGKTTVSGKVVVR